MHQMKKDLHPRLHDVKASCTCGETFEMRSSRPGDLQLEVCSKCHPYYTGKQKLVDTSGQVEKFRKKFGGGG